MRALEMLSTAAQALTICLRHGARLVHSTEVGLRLQANHLLLQPLLVTYMLHRPRTDSLLTLPSRLLIGIAVW